jgi:replication protein
MFTTYNNNYLLKSQSNIIKENQKELRNNIFNIIFYIMMLSVYLKIVLNSRIIPINIIYTSFILYFSYNFINNIKDFKELIFINKELKSLEVMFFFKEVKEKIDPKLNIKKLSFADDIKKIKEKEIEIVIATGKRKKEENKDIEKILEKPSLRKIKQMDKLKELKGTLIKKDRIESCMNWVSIQKNKTITTNYCKDRFCSICSYIKSFKNKIIIEKILKKLEDKKLLFLTLTNKNVIGDELEEEVENYTTSFSKLTKKKGIKENLNGYIRKIEIDYNKERNDYNIHLHSILLMKNYKKNYIKKEKWLESWREVKKDKNITQIDIKEIKGNNKNITEDIKKISNYISKENLQQNMYYTNEVSDTIYKATKYKKDITYSGEFREIKREIEKDKASIKEENKIISYTLLKFWNKEENRYIN